MELVLPQAGKMTHALKKLHIVERCFRTGAEGKAAPSALHESKGIFSFTKESIPFTHAPTLWGEKESSPFGLLILF